MRLVDADHFERVLMAMPDEELCEDCCYNVVNKLDEAPTIEAEPVKHGRWIDIPDKPEWDQKQCSICGDIRCCQGKYCPNCGARMDREADDEE